jgi:hypothetical protein
MSKRILHLTLKKKWFNMELSGEKPEEYREIKKYWRKRLLNDDLSPKEYDIVRLTNGYGADKPSFDREWKGLIIDKGNPKWGAEKGKQYFTILLGDVIGKRNIR